ncbi:MAG: hypothetical protein JOZ78_02635 [Chroococcidiopsidaceae cyanobacterium CP_BM_ER_R8_30]|nr:hypothetical protein [Chroococcidiopsidaceae cyanobacterium CP_BM_ER_R8_30]
MAAATGVIAGMQVVARPANAAVFDLTNGNATASFNNTQGIVQQPDISKARQTGITVFQVDNMPVQYQNGFWVRVGSSGGESLVGPNTSSLTEGPLTQIGNNQASITYTDPGSFTLALNTVLAGGAIGSGQASLTQTANITNVSSSPLDFHLFEYYDFFVEDVSGTSSIVSITGGNNALATWTENGTNIDVAVSSPVANRYEVEDYPILRNSLNDSSPTVLNNDGGPKGPGDLPFALEQDLNIPIGQTITIATQERVATAVPEPTEEVGLLLFASFATVKLFLRRAYPFRGAVSS